LFIEIITSYVYNMSMYKKFSQFIFPIPLRQSTIVWLPAAFLIIVLDQLTKYIVVQSLYLGQNIPVFPGFDFTLIYNYGAAFGFLNRGEGWQVLFLSLIAIVAASCFIVWLARTPRNDSWTGFGICLLLGGALGNLIDRLYHGYVIDFLYLHYESWHWPAFNLADSAICVGAFLIMIQLWREKK